MFRNELGVNLQAIQLRTCSQRVAFNDNGAGSFWTSTWVQRQTLARLQANEVLAFLAFHAFYASALVCALRSGVDELVCLQQLADKHTPHPARRELVMNFIDDLEETTFHERHIYVERSTQCGLSSGAGNKISAEPNVSNTT